MSLPRLGLAALLAASLAACAAPGPKYPTAPPPRNAPRPPPRLPIPPPPVPPDARPTPAPAPPPTSDVLRLSALPGWAEEDHLAALRAYQAGCGAEASAARVCREARSLVGVDDAAARRFLESRFRLEPVGQDLGLLTAYFAPEYEARSTPDGEFTAPVRPRPADLDPAGPYAERAEIEARPAPDALAWMRPEDLFFLQIQGSGSLTFPGGRRLRANFAGHNGRGFVGIATPMRQRGLLADSDTSGEAIRAWLASHGGPQADAIMRLNPRYVFFSLGQDDGSDPAGAAGIRLPAGRAIAVDPSFHAYGAGYWIDATAPVLTGAFPVYRRLVMALDTGGAIRGQVRADLYLGRGREAGVEAGRVRHSLRMFRLVPIAP
ncbi:MAG: transglycosylase [Caulobacteraceae bacterium]|nr:transglycosylase [Caulobacteraceae bacterium]